MTNHLITSGQSNDIDAVTEDSNDGNEAKEAQVADPPLGDPGSAPAYKVGYGSPPLPTRFKKGVSGNPLGKRIAPSTSDAILLALADKPIIVQEDGRKRKMTTEQLIYATLTRDAARGVLKAIKEVFALMASHERQYGFSKVSWNTQSAAETDNYWKREMILLKAGVY